MGSKNTSQRKKLCLLVSAEFAQVSKKRRKTKSTEKLQTNIVVV